MTMFMHIFCLCPLRHTIKLNFKISKVTYLRLKLINKNAYAKHYSCVLVYTYHIECLHQPGVVKTIETHSDNGIPSENFGLIYRNKMHSNKSQLLYNKLVNPKKGAQICPFPGMA